MNEDILYIRQFLAGEEGGFESLVKKYQDKVLNIIYSIIGVDGDSEDIAQEVFMKVYYNLRFFKQNSQFSTWLYRITVNSVYSFKRKQKDVVSGKETIENNLVNNKNPRNALLRKEENSMLRDALAKVPIKFKAAMVLKDIEGLSYAEISAVLRCRIGTVESKIYRARKFLKEELYRIGGMAT